MCERSENPPTVKFYSTVLLSLINALCLNVSQQGVSVSDCLVNIVEHLDDEEPEPSSS